MNGEELAVLRLGPVNGPAAQMGGTPERLFVTNSASWRVDKRQICETVEKGMYF